MNLKEFSKALQKMSQEGKDEFYLSTVNEISARFLTRVKKLTPVGKGEYETFGEALSAKMSGQRQKEKGIKLHKLRPGGYLRRGWNAIPAKRLGNVYKATVGNNVEYAPYVEYGHRQQPGRFVPVLGKRLKRTWVPGVHMMQKSHDAIRKEVPVIIRRRLHEWLERGLR